ncbi:MAG: tetratricopeptide repeat protein [Planctomycetota bacterium]|nr:tetratricopeptide repeat protein [Planctomycetota bacterium]MDG1985631.1 tetratricopeptide repeat protein [Planctomycetota bacterium]
MKGTGFATLVAAVAMTAGLAPAIDQQHAAAVVLPATSVASPSGKVRVTVVEGRANAPLALSVRALVVQPGALASWVTLPLTEIPQRLIVPDDQSILCVEGPSGSRRVVELDLGGKVLRSQSLTSLLPDAGSLTAPGSMDLVFSDSGPCLAVELGHHEAALIGVGAAHAGRFEVCSIIAYGSPQQSVADWLRKSRDLLRTGDDVGARVALESARRDHPTDPRVYQQLARLHESAGDPMAQLHCLQEGLLKSHGASGQAITNDWQVGTPEARLVVELVETTRQVHGDAEASRTLGEALTLYPCMEQAVILRAELLFASGGPDEAIASLERALAALEGSDESSAAMHDIGRFLQEQGRDEEALTYMNRAFQKGGFSEFLIRDIAELHLQAGQSTLAARWLTKLADHWASVANGSSGVDRALRGHRRLAELRREIEALEGSGAEVTDP